MPSLPHQNMVADRQHLLIKIFKRFQTSSRVVQNRKFTWYICKAA